MSYDSSKAIAEKFKAIQQAVKDQDKKKAAESVRKPSKSYSSSRKRSTRGSSGGSSSGKSSKTVSGNVKQGGNGEKTGSSNGLTPPPGYSGPIPPQAPSIYDEGQPLAGKKPKNDTGMPKDTQKAVEQAPYSPIKEKPSGKKNVEYYDVETKDKTFKPKTKQKDDNVVITQRQYGEIKAGKSKLEETGQKQIGWEPDPNAAYYTIKDKDFDPTYLHGPGATKETAVDLYPDKPGWQLTPKQTDIYFENIGKKNIRQAEEIDPGENIVDYAKKHATFKVDDKEKTWEQLKKEQPALTLKKTDMQDVVLAYDYTRWYKEQDSITKNVGRFFGGFANPDYIVETVGRGRHDKGTDIVAKWTYEQKQRLKQKDYLGMTISTPAVQNIALPAAGGAAFGAVVRGGSAITQYLGKKGLTYTASALKFGGRAALATGTVAVGGLAAADIARTKPEKRVAKALTYGTQLASFGAGSKAVQKMKIPKVQREIVEIKMPGQPKRMIGQKYVEVFGKKFYSPKRTVAVGPRQAPINIRKGFGSGKTGLDFSPDLGYKNVGGRPTSIYNIKWQGAMQTSAWQGKTFFDTGGGWQPKTGMYKPVDYPMTAYSSKMPMKYKWPGKPTVYGSYNMPYMSWKKPMLLESGSVAGYTEGMIKIRPKRTFKNFNKEFRSIDKSLGQQPGVSQGQKQQTVQLLKLKQAQKQKVSLQQQQKQALKTLSKQKLLQKQTKKSMFHPEYQHKAIGSISSIKTVNAVFPIQMQRRMSAYASASAQLKDMQRKSIRQDAYPVFSTRSSIDSLFGSIFKNETLYEHVSPQKTQLTRVIPKSRKTIDFTLKYEPIRITPSPGTGRLPSWEPKRTKRKKEWYENDILKGYRFRTWKGPELKDLIGVDF